MFNDEIVWAPSNDERRICQSNPLGKRVRQCWFFLRARFRRRRSCRIEHYLCAVQLNILQKMRNPMADESEQAVVDIQRIHIDGLDRRWPGRHRVKISNRQIAEWIAFETEIHL